jgi:hypothetical protein
MRLTPYSFNSTQINDGTNYVASFVLQPMLTPGRAIYTKRSGGTQYPAYAGKELSGGVLRVRIFCKGTLGTQFQTLKALFDTANVTPARLVAQDAEDSNRQFYVDASVIDMSPPTARVVVVTFALKDPVWKTVNTTTESTWTITASGQTDATTINLGNLDAYPIYDITPTSSRSGNSYVYRRFIEVTNNKNWAFNNYPLELLNSLDTSALVSGGKMQADGDDLRIYVDGAEEENRWLSGINTAATKCWINLDLAAKQTFTLKTAIGTAGAITAVEVNEDISNMPDEGIIKIDSERLTYSSKDESARSFGGTITRGAKESTAATHLAAATVTWIEHDIYMYYGDASATAPAADDTQKPMFNLTSTNTSWDYDDFWSTDPRSGEWRPAPSPLAPVTYTYTANQMTDADPAAELGLLGGRITNLGAATWSFWRITHPAGITDANFANGQKYNLVLGEAVVQYNTFNSPLSMATTWATWYTIPATTVANTWQSWSNSATLGATYYHLRLAVKTRNACRVEAADVTLTLASGGVPTRTLGSEVTSVYDLNCVLKNTTTGESLTFRAQIEQSQILRINTLEKTVRYLKDGANFFSTMRLTGTNPVRTQWLRLQQGANTLSFTDAGTGNVEVVIKWQGRNN